MFENRFLPSFDNVVKEIFNSNNTILVLAIQKLFINLFSSFPEGICLWISVHSIDCCRSSAWSMALQPWFLGYILSSFLFIHIFYSFFFIFCMQINHLENCMSFFDIQCTCTYNMKSYFFCLFFVLIEPIPTTYPPTYPPTTDYIPTTYPTPAYQYNDPIVNNHPRRRGPPPRRQQPMRRQQAPRRNNRPRPRPLGE